MDFALLFLAVWASYNIGSSSDVTASGGFVWLLLMAPVIAFPIFVRMGLYRAVIRYLTEHVLWTILRAMSLSAVLWGLLAYSVETMYGTRMELSVVLLYWTFGIMLIAGVRFATRWLIWLQLQQGYRVRQALIYGAGEAGRQIAATLREGRDVFPAGFLDDDKGMQGKDVNGLRVYPPKRLRYLIDHYAIHEVIVALPSISSGRRREIVEMLERYPVHVRILPEVSQMANGRHLVNSIREVDIGDLLGRDVVAPDLKLLGQSVTGRNVLVTGAGGSIGTELCRQISALLPKKLVLLEQSEYALYQIERQLRKVVDCDLIGCLGSVGDAKLVEHLLRVHEVQTVYHAAAYKHVPLVEENVIQGCINNVFGTMTVARAAFEAGVNTFVLISSDKAVRPTNVMGATKRWAELIVQCLAQEAHKTGGAQRFCAVRFGNVLGSSGSVIPLFREQIDQGGPVTVTHPEVTRYFMSIHEAVQLVIQAGSLSQGGEIFLLDMGSQVQITDLAKNMIRLTGRTIRDEENPEGDIDIVYIGLRPGEKLKEELLIANTNVEGTSHPKVMKVSEPTISREDLAADMQRLRDLIEVWDVDAARDLLMQRSACQVPKVLKAADEDSVVTSPPQSAEIVHLAVGRKVAL